MTKAFGVDASIRSWAKLGRWAKTVLCASVLTACSGGDSMDAAVVPRTDRPVVAPGVRSSSTATANNAASITIAKPAAVSAGDLLVAFITNNGGSYVSVTPPSGWTPIPATSYVSGPTDASTHGYYKVAASTDTSFTFAAGPHHY